MTKNNTRKNPKQSRSSEMLADILEGTKLGLQKFGVSKLSTNKISEITGISVGSFYQYFKNKEAAFLELSEKLGDNTTAKLDEIFAQTEDSPLRERVDFMVDAYADMFLKHQNYFNTLSQIVIRFNKSDLFINKRKKFHQQAASFLQKETGKSEQECLKFAYFFINNINGTLHALAQTNQAYLDIDETKVYLKSVSDHLLDEFIGEEK